MAIVYKITNLKTGKIYFGWTIQSLRVRFAKHCRNKRQTYYVALCIQKYGKENFMCEQVFEFQSSADAMEKERELIAIHKTNVRRWPDGIGMNMTDGGEGTEGYRHDSATKEKIRATSTGRKHSQKTRKTIGENSKALIRKPHTEEHKKKIGETLKAKWENGSYSGTKGKRFSQKTRLKMSMAALGKPKSEQHKANMRKPKGNPMKNITAIENSSNLVGYHYDAEMLKLIIQFKGDTYYLYTGVPQEIVDEFAASLSKGGFLSVKIKGKYPCTKLVDTSEKIVEKIACD